MNTIIETKFVVLQALKDEHVKIDRLIKQQRADIVEAVANEFINDVESIKTLLQSKFAKVEMTPVPFGFEVTSPEFKQFYNTGDLSKYLDATSNGFRIKCIDEYGPGKDVAYPYVTPKKVKITLTKSFIQSRNKDYKKMLTGIDIF